MSSLAGPLLAAVAGGGTHLLWSALALGQRRLVPPRAPTTRRRSRASVDWLAQAGLGDVAVTEFVAAVAAVAVVTGVVVYAVFGGVVPAIVAAAFAASFPPAAYRTRRRERMAVAQEAWPRLIEEIRILTGSVGRSIPQALLDVGTRGPEELRPAFAAARREWQLSTDFEATIAVLKAGLADPTADSACETLLVAHELGGTDLDRRLAALAEDRVLDTQGRKDARARQAGVRFARRFVLLVPAGMAVAGMSVGSGRSSYATAFGQAAVVAGIGMVVACWVWSGRVMRLPDEQRVFDQ